MSYDLDKLEELDRAATPAPWDELWVGGDNFDLLIALRNAAPALFADLRRLQAENEEMSNRMIRIRDLPVNNVELMRTIARQSFEKKEMDTQPLSYQEMYKNEHENCMLLTAQLAAAQAENARMREALEKIVAYDDEPYLWEIPWEAVDIARRALAAEDGEG